MIKEEAITLFLWSVVLKKERSTQNFMKGEVYESINLDEKGLQAQKYIFKLKCTKRSLLRFLYLIDSHLFGDDVSLILSSWERKWKLLELLELTISVIFQSHLIACKSTHFLFTKKITLKKRSRFASFWRISIPSLVRCLKRYVVAVSLKT